ncbi:hypothetical protein NKG05_27020 [Oerskovia sp. M15]
MTTVGDVLRAGPTGLERLPGIGPQTAAHCLAAARQIAQAVHETLRFRIDDAPGDPYTTGLVQALAGLDAARTAATVHRQVIVTFLEGTPSSGSPPRRRPTRSGPSSRCLRGAVGQRALCTTSRGSPVTPSGPGPSRPRPVSPPSTPRRSTPSRPGRTSGHARRRTTRCSTTSWTSGATSRPPKGTCRPSSWPA